MLQTGKLTEISSPEVSKLLDFSSAYGQGSILSMDLAVSPIIHNFLFLLDYERSEIGTIQTHNEKAITDTDYYRGIIMQDDGLARRMLPIHMPTQSLYERIQGVPEHKTFLLGSFALSRYRDSIYFGLKMPENVKSRYGKNLLRR